MPFLLASYEGGEYSHTRSVIPETLNLPLSGRPLGYCPRPLVHATDVYHVLCQVWLWSEESPAFDEYSP
jgi:hypothetical protein